MTVRTKIIIAKCIAFPVYFLTVPITFIVHGFRGIIETWKMFIEIDEAELRSDLDKSRKQAKEVSE